MAACEPGKGRGLRAAARQREGGSLTHGPGSPRLSAGRCTGQLRAVLPPAGPGRTPGGGSTLTAPALPAVSWQLRRPGTTKISLIEVSTLPGDSRAYA